MKIIFDKFIWFFDRYYYIEFDVLVLVMNMAYIYMDESWDLWFKNIQWWSKYFIITFLVSKSEKELEVVMKNVRKRANWSKMKIYWSFFHSNNLAKQVIKRCLDLTSRRDVFAMSIIADKTKIPFNFKNNVHYLYNYLVWELLELCQKRDLFPKWEKIIFVASRRETNKQLNNKFIEYLNLKKYDLFHFDFIISNPNQFKWLEVVDAIAFSIHQKYEFNEFELYSVIKNKIILEKQIF